MLNQKGASRTDTIVKLALVFIISLLSFSIGTFVGKQFSDQQHKTAMIERDGGQSRSTASIPTNSLEVQPENALTDADIASITEEFAHAEKDEIDELLADKATTNSNVEVVEEVTEEKTETPAKNKDQSIEDMVAEVNEEKKAEEPMAVEKKDMPTVAKQETMKKEMPTALPKKDAKNDVVSDTATKVAMNKKPVVKDKKEVSRIPTSLPSKIAASTVGKYTIQIAAYQKEAEAKAHSNRLTNQGYSAFYLSAKVKGNTWYRVNVGLFANRSKAKVFRKQLMKEASLKSALIKKVVR